MIKIPPPEKPTVVQYRGHCFRRDFTYNVPDCLDWTCMDCGKGFASREDQHVEDRLIQLGTSVRECPGKAGRPKNDWSALTGFEGTPGEEHLYAADKVAGTGEVRVTDPTTGGQKGIKPERFDLIPPDALAALARHYGRGAEKYDENQYLKGYNWKLSEGALMRHLMKWKMGEDIDAETGSHHLTAVAWHAFTLFVFQKRKLGTDHRLILEKNDAP